MRLPEAEEVEVPQRPVQLEAAAEPLQAHSAQTEEGEAHLIAAQSRHRR